MATDSTYPQLEKASHLLVESIAKLEFLHTKLVQRLDATKSAAESILANEDDSGKDKLKWKKRMDDGNSLALALISCNANCVRIRDRIRELIAMKDSLLCDAMKHSQPLNNVELLPEGTRIERMVMELSTESTECSICTENVKKYQSIWSCNNCYNIFHLECANTCMQATKKNGTWACPYCRDSLKVILGGLRYSCFCGRVLEPKFNRNNPSITPHSCGGKCTRNCGNLCHPGPC